jgi:hypothetical protein
MPHGTEVFARYPSNEPLAHCCFTNQLIAFLLGTSRADNNPKIALDCNWTDANSLGSPYKPRSFVAADVGTESVVTLTAITPMAIMKLRARRAN